jgi:ribonuclease HI
MNKLELFIDGACKGNPGPSGIGVVILRDGAVVKEISRYIGEATNNIAEYSALICALEESLLLKADTIVISSDSQLLCRQINKQYQVKSGNIIGLYEQALRLLSGFRQVHVNHIPREKNKLADRLATKAVLDARNR